MDVTEKTRQQMDETQRKVDEILTETRKKLEELGCESILCSCRDTQKNKSAMQIVCGCSNVTMANFVSTLFENNKMIPMLVSVNALSGLNERISKALKEIDEDEEEEVEEESPRVLQ